MKKFVDLKNKEFGFWTVQNQYQKTKYNQIEWLCKCICGTVKYVTANSLKTTNSTSCGCNVWPNLKDKKFGQLTVLYPIYFNKRKYWLCKCECGNRKKFTSYQLKTKKSCGLNCF
jgi:hypothetical protein